MAIFLMESCSCSVGEEIAAEAETPEAGVSGVDGELAGFELVAQPQSNVRNRHKLSRYARKGDTREA